MVDFYVKELIKFAGKEEDSSDSDELAIKVNSLKEVSDGDLKNYLIKFPLSVLSDQPGTLETVVKLKADEIANKKKDLAIEIVHKNYAELQAIKELNLPKYSAD